MQRTYKFHLYPTKEEQENIHFALERATGYIDRYGYECWELDALRPDVMESLIRDNVYRFCDLGRFEKIKELE